MTEREGESDRVRGWQRGGDRERGEGDREKR